ncbi:MAG: hypothetical protein KA712_14435 [Myxococcales bacterium]|nr:hypothetical protein [Myxococcales bacterium]
MRRPRHRVSGVVVVMGVLGLWRSVLAAEAPASPGGRPESAAVPGLDGRVPPPPPRDLALARGLLAPLRAAAWLVSTPVDAAVGFVERHELPAHAYELLTSDDRLVGVRPSVRYESGFALAGGVHFFDRRSLGPGSFLGLNLGGGPRSFDTTFALSPPGRTGLRLSAWACWQGDALFGGLTGQSTQALRDEGFDLARYQVHGRGVGVGWRWPLAGGLRTRTGVDLHDRRYANGLTDGPQQILNVYCPPGQENRCALGGDVVPGFARGLTVLQGRGELALDTRRDPRFGSGWLGALEGVGTLGVAGDPSRHAKVQVGFGRVLTFGHHGLDLRVQAGALWRLGTAPIPFEELLSPSGPRGLRGLRSGRLRGPTALVATVQYRWLLAPWMDALLFVDKGNAFRENFENLSWAQTFTSYGLSFQLVERARSEGAERNVPSLAFTWAYTPGEGMRYAVVSNVTAW